MPDVCGGYFEAVATPQERDPNFNPRPDELQAQTSKCSGCDVWLVLLFSENEPLAQADYPEADSQAEAIGLALRTYYTRKQREAAAGF